MRKVSVAVESLSMSEDFFAIFELKPEFKLDENLLHQRYLALQKIFHPDKIQDSIQKTKHSKYLVKVNDAYIKLKDQQKRAECLLALNGIIVNQETGNNIEPRSETLLLVMDLSEEKDINQMKILLEQCFVEFERYFAAKNYTEAAQEIIKSQYLNKLLKS